MRDTWPADKCGRCCRKVLLRTPCRLNSPRPKVSSRAASSLGKKFTARYRNGRLDRLEFAQSQFVRSDQPIDFKDPFGEGFPILGKGSALGLSPPLEGTHLSHPTALQTPQEDCLRAAREFLADHGLNWELVLGLIEDDGRGWPHAWVRHRTTRQELDPSRSASAGEPPRYLALPADRAAQVYLELLGKQRALVRVAMK